MLMVLRMKVPLAVQEWLKEHQYALKTVMFYLMRLCLIFSDKRYDTFGHLHQLGS